MNLLHLTNSRKHTNYDRKCLYKLCLTDTDLKDYVPDEPFIPDKLFL